MKVSITFLLKGIAVIALVSVGVFFAPQKASAHTDVGNTFCDSAFVLSGCTALNSGLTPYQTRAQEALIKVHIGMTTNPGSLGALPDDTNPKDVKGYVSHTGSHPTVDTADNLRGWESLWPADLETGTTTQHGVYLYIGTEIQDQSGHTITNPDLPTINDAIAGSHAVYRVVPQSGVTGSIPGMQGSDGTILIDGYLGLENRDTSGNMLLLDNDINFLVRVSGLQPETTYYARLSLEENSMPAAAYTKIISFTTPAATGTTTDTFSSNDYIQAQQANTNGTVGEETNLPSCGAFDERSSIMGCVAQIVYYIIFQPTAYVMTLAGEIMDWGIGYSIDSNSYPTTGDTFVTKGWRIMRDLSNMLFIFVLLYIAIATILDIGGVNTGKMIGTVIIVALLINFSMFFVKVIVDAGNIMTRVFYNQVSVCNNAQPYTGSTPSNTCEQRGFLEITGTGGKKSISYGFASKFNPTVLFSVIQKGGSVTAGSATLSSSLTPSQFAGFYALFSFIGALVNLVAAFVFFSLAWLFVGRVIAIWLMMIFAPLVFIFYTLPKGATSAIPSMLNPDKYWTDLIKQSFMPVMAMLMIFLILSFLNTNIVQGIAGATSTTGKFMAVLVPLMLITMLLLATKKTATEMSGMVAEYAGKVGSFVGGAAVGIATGGAALAGRRVLGGLGSTLANNENLKKTALGRGVMSAGRRMETATYDVKNTKIAQFGLDKAGFNPNQAVNTTVKTNYKDYKQTQAEKREKYKESMKLSDKSTEVSAMTDAKEALDREKEKRGDARQKFDIVNKRYNAGLATQQERDAAAQELQNAENSHDTQNTVYKDAKRTVDATNAKIIEGITKNTDISDQNIKNSWQNIGQQQGVLNKTGATLKAIADTVRITKQTTTDVVAGSLSGRAATVAKFRKEYQKLARAANPPATPTTTPTTPPTNPTAPPTTTNTTPPVTTPTTSGTTTVPPRTQGTPTGGGPIIATTTVGGNTKTTATGASPTITQPQQTTQTQKPTTTSAQPAMKYTYKPAGQKQENSSPQNIEGALKQEAGGPKILNIKMPSAGQINIQGMNTKPAPLNTERPVGQNQDTEKPRMNQGNVNSADNAAKVAQVVGKKPTEDDGKWMNTFNQNTAPKKATEDDGAWMNSFNQSDSTKKEEVKVDTPPPPPSNSSGTGNTPFSNPTIS